MRTVANLYIRLARPSDCEAVLRFSEHTWEWGDYLPFVWDTWLAEESGRLLVATLDRRPVGIAHVTIVASGEAWLEGLRVDPDYRRQGVATRLTQRCLKTGVALGASVVRFATASTNTPVHRIAHAIGFSKVASLLPRQAQGLSGPEPPFVQPLPKDLPVVLSFLEKSAVLAATGGLCNTKWRFHRLTREEIKKRLNMGMVRLLGTPSNISALGILGTGYSDEGLVLSFCDGTPDGLGELARGLRAEAAHSKPGEVTAWLPEGHPTQEIFARLGYEPWDENPLWIYQKELAG